MLHAIHAEEGGAAGIKAAMAGNKAFWAQRPLMQQAVEYASQDVLHLVELAKQQRSKLVESTANMLYTLSRKSSQLTWDTNDRSERCAPAVPSSMIAACLEGSVCPCPRCWT